MLFFFKYKGPFYWGHDFFGKTIDLILNCRQQTQQQRPGQPGGRAQQGQAPAQFQQDDFPDLMPQR